MSSCCCVEGSHLTSASSGCCVMLLRHAAASGCCSASSCCCVEGPHHVVAHLVLYGEGGQGGEVHVPVRQLTVRHLDRGWGGGQGAAAAAVTGSRSVKHYGSSRETDNSGTQGMPSTPAYNADGSSSRSLARFVPCKFSVQPSANSHTQTHKHTQHTQLQHHKALLLQPLSSNTPSCRLQSWPCSASAR